MSKNRGWCFTINNFTDDEYGKLSTVDCRYICYGKEIGEGGTHHIQGYVEFQHPVRLSNAKQNICARAHLEPRRGSPQQASDYCKKDGTFLERGDLPQQGKRSDLEQIAEAVLSKSFQPEDYPVQYIKFHRGIESLANSQHTDRAEPPVVHWRWGLSGVGKTRYVFDTHGTENIYIKDSSMWWDGYKQQQVILIDDFCGKWPFRDFLRLLDRYPYQGQYKGGYIKINSPYIYITCEFPPSHFYREPNELAQVTRRLSVVCQVLPHNLSATHPRPPIDERTGTPGGTEVAGNTIPPPNYEQELWELLANTHAE